MKLRDEDLKEAYRASYQAKAAGGVCPSVETLLGAFSPDLREEDKLKIADHVSECGLCFRKFKAIQEMMRGIKTLASELEGVALNEAEISLLRQRAKERIRELEKERKKEEKEKLRARTRAYFFRYWPAALAAGMVIVILVGFLIFKFPPSRKEDIVRGQEGGAIELIAPEGQVESLPIVFEWEAVPGVKEYEAVLMDAELNALWLSGKIKEPRVELPFEVGKKIQLGKPYYWKVLVYNKTGEAEESGVQKFKLESLK